MKFLLYTSLYFLSIVLFFTSCKSNDFASEYKRFYNTVNDDYAYATRRVQDKPKPAKKDKKNNEKKNENVNNSTASAANNRDSLYIAKMEVISENLKTIVDALAGMNISVSQSATSPSVAGGDNNRVLPAKTESTVIPATSAAPMPKEAMQDTNKDVSPLETTGLRIGSVSVVNDADKDLLKTYNVMIASLKNKSRAEWLKGVFEGSGERIIVVKSNNNGLYYVIIGSYDELGDAVAKRNKVSSEYTKMYTKSQLQRKYAIPFTDLWILKNQ